jgi:hypothetical protein
MEGRHARQATHHFERAAQHARQKVREEQAAALGGELDKRRERVLVEQQRALLAIAAPLGNRRRHAQKVLEPSLWTQAACAPANWVAVSKAPCTATRHTRLKAYLANDVGRLVKVLAARRDARVGQKVVNQTHANVVAPFAKRRGSEDGAITGGCAAGNNAHFFELLVDELVVLKVLDQLRNLDAPRSKTITFSWVCALPFSAATRTSAP